MFQSRTNDDNNQDRGNKGNDAKILSTLLKKDYLDPLS